MGIVKNTNPKDVLQSIINNFVSSDYTPRDIVTCAKDLALSKYSVNAKVEGKIELSNSYAGYREYTPSCRKWR